MTKLMWLCGAERTLVEEVVSTVRDQLAVSDLDYVRLVAGEVPEKEVWAAANQYPLDATKPRLVMVRDAEKLKRWSSLREWVANGRLLPTVHLLLVSNDTDLPYVYDKDGKRTSELKEHGQIVRDASMGQLISCSTPATKVPLDKNHRPVRPGPPDIVLWVQRQAAVSDSAAQYLLERTGGDLAQVKNVCRKAAVLSGMLTEPAIDLLSSESPGDAYAEYLLRLQKRPALLTLEALPDREYSRTIGLLDSRLEFLLKLNSVLRKGMALQAILRTTDLNQFMAMSYYKIAKAYDPARVRHCRRVLAVADDALRGGAREAVMESLTVLW